MSIARRPVSEWHQIGGVYNSLQCIEHNSDLSDSVSDSKFSVKTLASIHPLVIGWEDDHGDDDHGDVGNIDWGYKALFQV